MGFAARACEPAQSRARLSQATPRTVLDIGPRRPPPRAAKLEKTEVEAFREVVLGLSRPRIFRAGAAALRGEAGWGRHAMCVSEGAGWCAWGGRGGEGETMHFLTFRIKRAHLASLRATREFCEEVELTVARFDFMRAAGTRVEGTRQNEITSILGLSREAVSKMVRRLIDLGLVRRERCPWDRRTYVVSLTEEGERRMRATYVRLHEEQPFQSLYERVFGPRSEITVLAVQNLDATLVRTGWFIGDTSRKWFYRSKDADC